MNDSTLSFLLSVSHEFKSPLTTIQTSTEILESYIDRLSVEEKQKHFQTIYESISNLSELIDDVIMFYKSDAKSIKPKYEKFELINHSIKIIEEIKNTFSKTHQINFYSKTKELNISSDKKLVSQILTNLISYVIKYSPLHEKVDVTIARLNGKAIIEVKDYGIVIPDNERDKIFTPFFRVQSTNEIAGTGLGLAIVQSLLKILGGKISFISDENIGTLFTVTIPVNGKIG
jgi:signal transduction histidine kinase